MSIVAYVGLPGSGKSYSVVEHVILPALKNGRPVYTNIPLHLDKLAVDIGEPDVREFDVQEMCTRPDYASEIEAGSVIVIDECWRVWASGTMAAQIPEAHKAFLAEHRHRVGQSGYSNEIVLVTQDLGQVARFVRDLVEETFRTTKLTAVGLSNKYKVDVYGGAVTGQRPPQAQLIRTLRGSYKPEIFQYYQSHTQSQDGNAGLEEKVDGRANILKSPVFVGGLGVAVLMIVFGSVKAMAFFGEFGKEHDTIPHPESHQPPADGRQLQAVAAPPGVAPARPAVKPPTYSERWRFAGIIQLGNRKVAVLDGERGSLKIDYNRYCSDLGFGNHLCQYRDELITADTGPAGSFVGQAIGQYADSFKSLSQ